MVHSQRGITALGGLFIAIFIGLVLYGGVRLLPAFLEYQKVSTAMKSLEEEYSGGGASDHKIRLSLERRFDIDDVDSIDPRDPRDLVITRDGKNLVVTADYSAVEPYLGNISFLVEFTSTATVRAN